MKNKYKDIQNTQYNIDQSGDNWTEKTFKYPQKLIRVATCFSGIGAIEYALRKLNLNSQIVFAGDIDQDCKKAYFANYEITENRWHNDIHDFNASTFYNQVDLLVGGAPCQAFSIRGKRGGFEDTRGTLFREFARVIKECQPKIFIFENVKGILNHDKGNTWSVIENTFENYCGYDVYYQILNSRNYGIPQNRERVFCVGFKNETDFKYPMPIPLMKSIHDFLDEKVDSKYILHEKGVHFITRSINHDKSYTQINGEVQLCQKRNQQFNWHGDFIFHPVLGKESSWECIYDVNQFEEHYFINKDLKKYVVTLDPNSNLNMLKGTTLKFNDSKGIFRKLTPRECLRLMGFGNDFKIEVSDTACYKQSGNSIVVNVLMALLKQIDITKYGI